MRRLTIENFEQRTLFAGMPLGAGLEDTAEYMLGRVAVTVVLLESNGIVDPSTEDWNPTHRQEVLRNIEDGLDWWRQALAKRTDKHTLDFVLDRKFVDSAFSTAYEPIQRSSDDYSLWANDFLVAQGYGSNPLLDDNMRAFNQSQRMKLQTDWAFTIFVVNSQNDSDGQFALGGTYRGAFSFAGGLFQVVPSTRPASTFAHETGHMFWALDEYAGGSSYYRQRGYYNTQNTNAIVANPDPAFSQQDSIMSEDTALDRAYVNRTSPASTFALVGWQDSDGDGIFDVLDVPLALELTGQYDPFSGRFRWTGRASVGTLPNLNSSGNQSSISIDRIARLETRIEGGEWTTRSLPNSSAVAVDVTIDVDPKDLGKVLEFRAISNHGITSQVVRASIGPATSRSVNTGVHGFAWNDLDRDGLWGELESGVAGQTITIQALSGTPPVGQSSVRASDLALGPITTIQNGMSLTSVGSDTDGRIGVQLNTQSGMPVFHPFRITAPTTPDYFSGKDSMLKIGFPGGTRRVEIVVNSITPSTRVRIDAYRSDGVILARTESSPLDPNTMDTISVETPSPMAYAVAYALDDHEFRILKVTSGFAAFTTTDTLGGYSFTNLPDGNYQLSASSNGRGIQVQGRSTGLASVSIDSQWPTRLDFSFFQDISPWTNPNTPYDVNNDTLINGVDALIIINTINLHGGGILVGSGIPTRPYIDVNDDGILNPLDALSAINYLNQVFLNQAQGESEHNPSLDEASILDVQDERRRRRRTLL